jgi:hypothetical protein
MVWKKPFFKRVSSKKTSFVLQLFTWKSIAIYQGKISSTSPKKNLKKFRSLLIVS